MKSELFLPYSDLIVTDKKSEIQKDLDAEHNRQKRSEPFRYPHERGVYAPRTLEEAGL
jgi:hypothetical protein